VTGASIRVLVVDHSPSSRAAIVEILAADPQITVVGEARDGLEALAKAHALRPDVITMDIRMPRMDGVEATKRIMTEVPTPIVIVSGTVQDADVAMSMQALRSGALSVLPKPPTAESPEHTADRKLFARTVRALAGVKVVRRREARESLPMQASTPPRRRRAHVVAIGGSTGGPAALRVVLEALPEDFSAPILVVQHLASGFYEGFARWLGMGSKLRVKLAEHDEPLRGGTVYVAPERHHLRVAEAKARVERDPAVGGFRPAATPLFESVASAFGERAVAVILTGMGRDGVDGLRSVRELRGHVIAQDQASSVVFGMPRAAIEAGIVDEVLPLRKIGVRLNELTQPEVSP
jgi:two-component system chemotaxis response regulator CheB